MSHRHTQTFLSLVSAVLYLLSILLTLSQRCSYRCSIAAFEPIVLEVEVKRQ